ncbi:MAG: agmatinase family protein [Chitinophagales bacterium]
MNKQQKINDFDPNDYACNNGRVFGLPFDYKDAKVVLLPVPWEVTVSYSAGTASGHQAILKASVQVDLYDSDVADAWKIGTYMLPVSDNWQLQNEVSRRKAVVYIDFLEQGGNLEESAEMQDLLKELNLQCRALKEWVKRESLHLLDDNKLVGIVGGDHSSPLGLIEALATKYDDFGILQIDAHADLRVAYEGFTYSHASIMHNALQNKEVSQLVMVGIRDICEAEVEYINRFPERITCFYDWDIKEKVEIERSLSWAVMCNQIIAALPQNVYISFDIDGLKPSLCPNTGTPVAGGFELYEVFYLLKKLVLSGRKIIGFDLCEVSPDAANEGDEWDANVGARVLYKLINLSGNKME